MPAAFSDKFFIMIEKLMYEVSTLQGGIEKIGCSPCRMLLRHLGGKSFISVNDTDLEKPP